MRENKDSADEAAAPPQRRRVPFLAHQFGEYVVAIALIAVGFHASGGAQVSLVTAGFLLAALNLLTSGPLGAVGVLSRRAHHAGDLVIAVALIALPIVFSSHLHTLGIALSEAVAALVVWMERSTSYAETPRSSKREDDAATSGPSAAQAAGAAAAALTPEATKAAKVAAHRLGLVAGVTRRVVRDRRGETDAKTS